MPRAVSPPVPAVLIASLRAEVFYTGGSSDAPAPGGRGSILPEPWRPRSHEAPHTRFGGNASPGPGIPNRGWRFRLTLLRALGFIVKTDGMKKPLLRLAALLTLSQVCLLYGGGYLLADGEQFGATESSCARACCHLAKAGSPSAKSCCSLRCGEDPTDPAPEPARAKQWVPTGLAAVQAAQPRPYAQAEPRDQRTGVAVPMQAPEQELYLRHSILLV